MTLRVGVNIVPLQSHIITEGGKVAEELGFTSVWLGEHLFMPTDLNSDYPAGANKQPFALDTPMLDPLLVLSSIAGSTERIRLGVGIYILPLRHPLLTAKYYVTLDHLSGGRLDFGYGTGWMREEFAALGVDFDARGKLTDETLAAMHTLFTEETPSIDSEHFSVPPISFMPKPLTGSRRSRIIGGGYTPRALRRLRQWDGWYGRVDRLHSDTVGVGGWNVGAVRTFVDSMHANLEKDGRDPAGFTMIGALAGIPTRDDLEALSSAGLDEIVVNPWGSLEGRHMGIASSLDAVREFAASVDLERPEAG